MKPTLILSPRGTKDSDNLWRAALKADWNIERVMSTKWELETLPAQPVIYGEPIFNQHIANQLGRLIVEPPEDFLAKLPYKYLQRKIDYMTVKEARKMNLPRFIKPPNHKCFPAKVYQLGRHLPEWLDDNEMVLVSSPVSFIYEARYFILNRKIMTWSPYLINGKRSHDKRHNRITNLHCKELVFRVLQDMRVELPDAVVLDCGLTNGGAAVIIEANEVCGSGLYAASPLRVLKVLEKGLI